MIYRKLLHQPLRSSLAAAALLFCLASSSQADVRQVGTISDPQITESSGLQASRRFPGIFWTHNDKGNVPTLFAITREGKTVGRFAVTGEKIPDWEDIALDNAGNIYIADTGNNTYDRKTLSVHMVKEPNPRKPITLRVMKSWKVETPKADLDGEAIFIHKGYCYIIGKVVNPGRAPMYRFPLGSKEKPPLIKVGNLTTAGRVTGADISRDGQRLAIVTEVGTHLFRINGNPMKASSILPPFTPMENSACEGGTFAGNGFLVSAETKQIYLITDSVYRTW